MDKPLSIVTSGVSKQCPAVVAPLCGSGGVQYVLHYHPEYEFQLIRRGEGVYLNCDGQLPFAGSELFVTRPNIAHGLVIPAGRYIDKIRLAFKPQLLSDKPHVAAVFAGLPTRMRLTEEETIFVEMLFRSINREVSYRDEYWRQTILAELEQLAYILKRISRKQRPHVPRHPAIRRVMSYIEQHFAEELRLKHLADIAGLSPNYLSSLFTRHTGTNLKQYILHRQIDQARRLLVEGPGLTVTDIALRVGFTRFADFNRNFKRLTGLTPTAYRKISYISGR